MKIDAKVLRQKLVQAREEDTEVLDNLRTLKGERYVAALLVAVDSMALHVSLLRLIHEPFNRLLRPMVLTVDGALQLHLAEALHFADSEQFTTDVLMVVERRIARVDELRT